jgi:hypothetical protein
MTVPEELVERGCQILYGPDFPHPYLKQKDEERRARVRLMLASVLPPEPDVETISAEVHRMWLAGKHVKGITSRTAEDGEELMVPYEDLSEAQKDQDRATVRTVLAALAARSAE